MCAGMASVNPLYDPDRSLVARSTLQHRPGGANVIGNEVGKLGMGIEAMLCNCLFVLGELKTSRSSHAVTAVASLLQHAVEAFFPRGQQLAHAGLSPSCIHSQHQVEYAGSWFIFCTCHCIRWVETESLWATRPPERLQIYQAERANCLKAHDIRKNKAELLCKAAGSSHVCITPFVQAILAPHSGLWRSVHCTSANCLTDCVVPFS